VKPGERVSFESFMASALHDPAHGYYSRRITGVGGRGDFTTAPMLADAPARAIAAWAARAMADARCRNLIEIGPGEGTLAAGVMRHLPWLTRLKTRLHLVETSAPLMEKQRKLSGARARWHLTVPQALAACGGKAIIFSNELVDAFPVRRFRKTGAGWRELELEFHSGGGVSEHLRPPAETPTSSVFALDFPVGQWVEVHDSYRKWLEEWLPWWSAGRMLTIDYGSIAERLYQRQPLGSIRGYLFQQRLAGAEIYQNIGRQDLTADVNFSDLIAWSAPWCGVRALTSLSAFLAAHAGVVGPADRSLLDEQGCGGAFMVLDQARTT
jgi:SAM-dependent MidA family methyltransferase